MADESHQTHSNSDLDRLVRSVQLKTHVNKKNVEREKDSRKDVEESTENKPNIPTVEQKQVQRKKKSKTKSNRLPELSN